MDGSSTKYYCENRKHCRFPWEKRAFVTEHTIMEEVEAAGDHKTKQQLARQTGYTGMSVLSRLYFLYGFNPTTERCFCERCLANKSWKEDIIKFAKQ